MDKAAKTANLNYSQILQDGIMERLNISRTVGVSPRARVYSGLHNHSQTMLRRLEVGTLLWQQILCIIMQPAIMCVAGQYFYRSKFAAGRKVRVSHGHFNIGMTHEFTNRVEINAFHHELRCEIVPHIVPAKVLYLRLFQQIGPRLLHVIQFSARYGRRKYQRVVLHRTILFFPSHKRFHDY
jgi:hypothetical protein